MKVLLISYYWYPWNNAGTFRWNNFGKYLDFDVLTSRRPMRSVKDNTIENTHKKVLRIGYKIPACVWGYVFPFIALFKKYDLYVFTSPPEALLFPAWVFQLFGKKVLVDIRDKIDRPHQYLKILIPVYLFFYNRINNLVFSLKIQRFPLDSGPVVYHGYEIDISVPFVGYYSGKVSRGEFLHRLRSGLIPDQSHKPDDLLCGSFMTYKKLGYPINFKYHSEGDETELVSVEQSANKMGKIWSVL